MSLYNPPLFSGLVANATTQFVGIPIGDGDLVSITIRWPDATSSATIVFQVTDFDSIDAPVDQATSANRWKAMTGVTITGPAASAAGAFEVNIPDIGARRGRLSIAAAADSTFLITASVKRRY